MGSVFFFVTEWIVYEHEFYKANKSELLEIMTRQWGKQAPYNKCIDAAAAARRMDDGTEDCHCKMLIF